MSSLPTLTRATELRHRRVLLRQDLNVPLVGGKITSAKRLDAALPAIRMAADGGAKVMLMSHMGRPEEGAYAAELSLAPVAEHLSRALNGEVKLCADYLSSPPQLADGEVMLLENVRFNIGETANRRQLAKQYAALCDVFVMDAFGVAHRAHASTEGVARYARRACAGPLLVAELTALKKAITAPQRPLIALVGGAKVSTKLTALTTLAKQVDHLLLGGGIANTFLAAAGHNIGNSLFEPRLVVAARELMAAATAQRRPIPIPDDVVVAKTPLTAAQPETETTVKAVHQLADDDMIFDLGPNTVRRYAALIAQAGTVVWNGPVGAFEFAQFAEGTKALGQAVAQSDAFSVAGGGDTLAAAEQFNLTEKLSCISTGGGAFLQFMEGKPLPALVALAERGELTY